MQRYHIIRMIGKGGMGEVYLAYDSVSSRKLALKRIRKDLASNCILKRRFLREARITSELVHPGILPVYTICSQGDPVYYTMPYIEGYTLKSLLKSAWHCDFLSRDLAEKTSIGNLLPVFQKICSTIAYVHTCGILHRDLKPDNILLGLFGEVVILDWGAAVSKEMSEDLSLDLDLSACLPYSNMTVPGKIVGTPDYMAPERLRGNPASERTDIYALGVILYQILTLSFPYRARRPGKNNSAVTILPPEDVAPHRGVPSVLSQIVMRALSINPEDRYASVHELNACIESYLQGDSSCLSKRVEQRSDDWELRHPIVLSDYFPTLGLPSSVWYSVAVSKRESSPGVRFECVVSRRGLEEGCGLFFPEWGEGVRGYGFWLQLQEEGMRVSLWKDGVELRSSVVHVSRNQEQFVVALESQNPRLSLLIEHDVVMMHMEYVPRFRLRIGMIMRHLSEIGQCGVIEGEASCWEGDLSVPDLFLYEGLYAHAATFYRRIVQAFPDRDEGYEAQFRLGVSLLESAIADCDHQGFSLALCAFSELHNSVAAPLEYLGKALVYQRLGEHSEEVKSLVLALKRYGQLPFALRVRDHSVYRLHETLYQGHPLSLVFMLLVLHMSPALIQPHEETCMMRMLREKIGVSLFCQLDPAPVIFRSVKMELLLSFWSGFSSFLPSLWQTLMDLQDYRGSVDLLYIAYDLCGIAFVQEYVSLQSEGPIEEVMMFVRGLECLSRRESPQLLFSSFVHRASDILILYLFDLFARDALMHARGESILHAVAWIRASLSEEHYVDYVLPYEILAYVWIDDACKVYDLLSRYYHESLWIESRSPAYMLYGYWLALVEEPTLVHLHFSGLSEDECSPDTLLAKMHSRSGLNEEHLSYQEKKRLLLQKFIFAHCMGDLEERKRCQMAYDRLAF